MPFRFSNPNSFLVRTTQFLEQVLKEKQAAVKWRGDYGCRVLSDGVRMWELPLVVAWNT